MTTATVKRSFESLAVNVPGLQNVRIEAGTQVRIVGELRTEKVSRVRVRTANYETWTDRKNVEFSR